MTLTYECIYIPQLRLNPNNICSELLPLTLLPKKVVKDEQNGMQLLNGFLFLGAFLLREKIRTSQPKFPIHSDWKVTTSKIKLEEDLCNSADFFFDINGNLTTRDWIGY